jgi:hypothetical protein
MGNAIIIHIFHIRLGCIFCDQGLVISNFVGSLELFICVYSKKVYVEGTEKSMMKEFQEYWIYHKWENIDKVYEIQ